MVYVDTDNKRIGLIDPEWKNKEGSVNKPYYYIKLFDKLLPEIVALKFEVFQFAPKGIPNVNECFQNWSVNCAK